MYTVFIDCIFFSTHYFDDDDDDNDDGDGGSVPLAKNQNSQGYPFSFFSSAPTSTESLIVYQVKRKPLLS